MSKIEKPNLGDKYATRGHDTPDHEYIVIGLPNIKGGWVTIAHALYGNVLSFPLDAFYGMMRRVA